MSSGVRTLEAFAMIRLYCAEGGELHPVDSPRLKDALWIDAVAPTPEEVEMLHKEFDIDLQDVADCLDPNERSRVEIEETYDLLVLRSILSEERNGDRIQTMPIGIFVTKSKVITVRIGSSFTYLEITSELKHKPRIDVKEDLFLALVRKVNKDIEKKVRPLERTIASIQEKILTAKRGEVAPSAFSLSNGLILLNTALLSNLNAISMLPRAKHLRLTKEKLDIAEDLENDVAQLYEMTTIYREIMSNVLNAYESTLANSLSTVMKTLTTISLILILPMMIAGWFSMNVALPFNKDAYWSFWMVVGVSVASVAGLWAFFRLKGIL
jgi:magnesium transporter